MGIIKYKDITYGAGGGGGASSESIAPIETSTTASQAYSKGDLFFYDDTLYKVTANGGIALDGTIITSGTSANVVETDVDTELKTLHTTATASSAGLMSASDKDKLDNMPFSIVNGQWCVTYYKEEE